MDNLQVSKDESGNANDADDDAGDADADDGDEHDYDKVVDFSDSDGGDGDEIIGVCNQVNVDKVDCHCGLGHRPGRV